MNQGWRGILTWKSFDAPSQPRHIVTCLETVWARRYNDAMEFAHGIDLATSSALSGYYVTNFVSPESIIDVLNGASIRFMLVGAHGMVGWTGEARATQDVDVLVGLRSQKKAVRLLTSRFPNLTAEDHEVVTRLRDQQTKKILVDVMKCNQPLFREAFRFSHQVQEKNQTFLVPSLELALAMKFAAMVSLTREDDRKHLDARDFIRMVRSNTEIDMTKLATLGELVYPGGGTEILEKISQVRAGEKLQL